VLSGAGAGAHAVSYPLRAGRPARLGSALEVAAARRCRNIVAGSGRQAWFPYAARPGLGLWRLSSESLLPAVAAADRRRPGPLHPRFGAVEPDLAGPQAAPRPPVPDSGRSHPTARAEGN